MAWEQVELALELQPRDAFEAGLLDNAAQLHALRDDREAATAWAIERMTQ